MLVGMCPGLGVRLKLKKASHTNFFITSYFIARAHAANGVFGLNSSSPIEKKIVGFTRFLTLFGSPNVAVSVTKLPKTEATRLNSKCFEPKMMF